MANAPSTQQSQQIQVITTDELSRGRFSNNLLIVNNQEEFVLDWMLSSPSGMHLVSRVIVTPAHMKRVIAALAENLHRHEQMFGQGSAPESTEQKFH